jgi:hypothetical protein
MDIEKLIEEKLIEERAVRSKAEKIVQILELIIKQNMPEKIGKCFYTIDPEKAFETAYKNSPSSFSDYPECSNNNLSAVEKYKKYKDRKPFIKLICKYCRN